MSEKKKHKPQKGFSKLKIVIISLTILSLCIGLNELFWHSATGEKGLHYFMKATGMRGTPIGTYLPEVNYTPWGISHIRFEAPYINIETWLIENYQCHELSLGGGIVMWFKPLDIKYFTHGWRCGDNPSFELYLQGNNEVPTAYIVNISS